MDLWTFTPRILARLIHQTNYNRTMPQHELRAEALDEDPIEIYTVNSAQSYVPNSFIKDDPVTGSPRGSGRQAGGPTRKGRQGGPSIDTPISKSITNSGAAWHCAEAGHFRQAEHTDPEGRRRRRIDFRPDWVDSARMRGVRGLLRASPSHFGLFSSHYGRVTGKLRMILNCANSPMYSSS